MEVIGRMTGLQEHCQNEHYFVGAVIDDRYHLTDFLGAGGMACVYKAQESGSPHRYAIKFLKDEYHNQPYLIDFFRDEASSMRDLAHPNIVRFYRFMNKEAYSYIIMEYVDGFALSDVIKRVKSQNRHIPLDEAMRIITQVARALDAIHREGYVHRDVKPSNVLIERGTGQTFLTDLGITTATNTRMEGAGTLAYMPPEMHETWVADQKADVYSFGILVYELLTKERPFNVNPELRGREAEIDILLKHKESPVPDASRKRRDLPKAVDAIIARALAKTPEDRYDTVIEVARDLHTALQPKLNDDMQDFANITHRHVIAPDSLAAAVGIRSRRLFMAVVAIAIIAVIAAILLGGYVAYNQLNTPPTATPSPTPSPTVTPTPHPLVGQTPFPLLEGIAALAEGDGSDALRLAPAEDGPLHYLRIGMVEGFRVTMQIAEDNSASRFGLAFRVQDAENYLRFTVAPSNGVWLFSEIVDGQRTIRQRGIFDPLPQMVTIAGLEGFFQVITDNQTITLSSEQFATGSLALYVENGTLSLDALTVDLVGAEADSALVQTPTPAPGIADPLRFIRSDLLAMRETNISSRTAVDCPAYIALHDGLSRHTDHSNQTVVELAERAQRAGEFIYQTCSSESPSEPYNFRDDYDLYARWESTLDTIVTDAGG